jgi:guanine deaminase
MTKETDKIFIRHALKLARKNAAGTGGGPFGAVVVQHGKIIAEGANQVTVSNDPTAHAEVIAIRNAAKKLGHFALNDCVLYTSCEPCPMCLAAAYWSRIGRVVYTATRDEAAAAGFDDALIYKEVTLPLGDRKIAFTQLGAEGDDPFDLWMNNPKRVAY